jgi:hypothetical protein
MLSEGEGLTMDVGVEVKPFDGIGLDVIGFDGCIDIKEVGLTIADGVGLAVGK